LLVPVSVCGSVAEKRIHEKGCKCCKRNLILGGEILQFSAFHDG
jgi:hypothetical protein